MSPEVLSLAEGRWFTRAGGVRVWRPHTPSEYVACPVCLARLDERCHTRSGVPHAARLVRRVCSCWGPIEPHESSCRWCRLEAAQGEEAA